jgi:hypothetical protein
MGGKPSPFLRLPVRKSGALSIMEDPRFVRVYLDYGGIGNLQASVFRRRVFDVVRLPAFHGVEDQPFVAMVVKAGFRLAYIDAIHVTYRVHGAHVSSAAGSGALDKRVRTQEELIRALGSLRTVCQLTPAETKALDRRLSRDTYWILGYSLLWQNGRRQQALEAFRRGMRLAPWNMAFWKTYALAWLRTRLRPNPTTGA